MNRGTDQEREESMTKALALLSAIVIPALLFTSSPGWPADHAELARVFQAMPPNGPFWQYGNVVMRSRTAKAGMPPVTFTHWNHRAVYTCRVCHLELGFSMRAGDSGISRTQYLAGKYCGACHNGEIAFTVRDGEDRQCGRCHMKDSGELEKRFERFAEKLPMTSFGNGIDWSEALESEILTPKNSVITKGPDIKFPEKLREPAILGTTSPRSDVTFSHEQHFAELDCSSCHPDIFNVKKKGTTYFSMERNIYGNFCGVCHMRVAFPMNDCRRCHVQMINSTGY